MLIVERQCRGPVARCGSAKAMRLLRRYTGFICWVISFYLIIEQLHCRLYVGHSEEQSTVDAQPKSFLFYI
jgi:hypothetical protein